MAIDRQKCKGAKKPICTASDNCEWVVGKGCKDKSPVRVSPRANILQKCKGAKKPICTASDNCDWVVGKGCKDKSPKRKSASPRKASPKRKSASPRKASPKRKSASPKRKSQDKGEQPYVSPNATGPSGIRRSPFVQRKVSPRKSQIPKNVTVKLEDYEKDSNHLNKKIIKLCDLINKFEEGLLKDVSKIEILFDEIIQNITEIQKQYFNKHKIFPNNIKTVYLNMWANMLEAVYDMYYKFDDMVYE